MDVSPNRLSQTIRRSMPCDHSGARCCGSRLSYEPIVPLVTVGPPEVVTVLVQMDGLGSIEEDGTADFRGIAA